MSRPRHHFLNRVVPGVTPLAIRLSVDCLRRRADRRKLVLLECGILRHAPFADCGRTIWDLLPAQRWFETTLPPAGWFRIRAESGDAPATAPGTDLPWAFSLVNGQQAIEWVEQYADSAGAEDQLLLAEEYFRHAEYAAEGDRFDTPDDRRDELEIAYGVASWLCDLRGFGPERWHVLDYYLASYIGQFYRWGGWRPLHPAHRAAVTGLIYDILGHPLRPAPRFHPAWRTGTVLALARVMYESRDFAAMPILADALQDAGCNNDDILYHCRGPGLHARGCWVVDLVLGKK